MFEDSLVESRNRLSSPTQRWTTLASLALQCVLAATVILLPLIHPETIPFRISAPAITLPKPPIPQVPHMEPNAARTFSTEAAAPAVRSAPLPDFHHLSAIHPNSDEAPLVTTNIGAMADEEGLPPGIAIATSGSGTRVTEAASHPAAPVRVSRGVSAGLLLAPIRPIYPPIAVSTRTEGMVVIEAIISKTGQIESIRATSGPALLRNAALDAVRHARYAPYLLNGQPTEVETTITVNFRLAG